MKKYGYRNSTDNLVSYTIDVLSKSGFNIKKIGCMIIAYMSDEYEQLFNYVFFNRESGLNEPDKQSILDAYEFCCTK